MPTPASAGRRQHTEPATSAVQIPTAVPVAASIGVLTRFAMEQYRASLLYKGKASLPTPAPSFTSAPQVPKPRRSRKPAGGAGDGA